MESAKPGIDMEDKKEFIEKYHQLKKLSGGQKPLLKDFLKFCNSHPKKLIAAFGRDAYTKLQVECGDGPNKLKMERTPLAQILDQYGQLARTNKAPPLTSDWAHAKFKPTTDAINKVHGIKWAEMPGIFIKEYNDMPQWKDVIALLKTEENGTPHIKGSKAFTEVVEKIENWKPDRKRIIEEGYKIELRNYLEKHFKLEEEVGESNPDILINGKIPIEIKKDPTQSEYDRLLGQMIRHNKTHGTAIAVVTSISSEDRFKKFQKLFIEVHDRLGMTAELICK